jgi:hypothetical protein
MKLMKVIYKMKNMMNKAFQHWMESKLIEVMNMKMQMIQFVSIVNSIQIKLRENGADQNKASVLSMKLISESNPGQSDPGGHLKQLQLMNPIQ